MTSERWKRASEHIGARARASKLSSSLLQPLSVFCVAAYGSAAGHALKPLILLTYARNGI